MSNSVDIDLARYAAVFKALSNPSRLRIFLRLRSCCAPGRLCQIDQEDCCCVGDVSQDLTIGPSTVSHHLKELRQAGLIRMERRGQKSLCTVNQDLLAEVCKFLGD